MDAFHFLDLDVYVAMSSNRMSRYLARCRKKATKRGSVGIVFDCVVFDCVSATVCVLLDCVGIWYVFCLLVVLVKLSVLTK